ncbi:hypothetical protein [Actinopolyspora mortivallis]|uniref:Tryptophan 2,3-dioxygenase n=1 Tax=Actinopolyspora mortivallis TaxID=33906 RepID=A0A2T0GXJ0_ACTMO|nr:hypothetical protein [Actinopolyspora mortivallis]PRW63814.1 hypothetical protein CEP50_08515 [Actinopolyspora mortivallis]
MSELWDELTSFNAAAYSERTHRHGRMVVANDSGLVRHVQRAATAARAIRERDIPLPTESTDDAVEIAGAFLEAQLYCLTHEKPRYEQYAAVPLVRRLIGVDDSTGTSVDQTRVWSVFRRLLEDQIASDNAASEEAEIIHKKDVSPEVCRKRSHILADVSSLVPEHVRNAPQVPAVESGRLSDIAEDRSGVSAIVHLLTIPQTNCHDEVAFLRIIQMSECLFWGALICVRQALAMYHAEALQESGDHIADATAFASPLVKLFHAVRAMPPDHFLGFRDATGDASAVQCRSWQELDAHMYGVLPEKRQVLADTPEVRPVLRLDNPDFLPLVSVAAELGGTSEEHELRDRIYTLDRLLLAWRKYHEKQLAGKTDPSYLPPGAFGSGGTSGYPYLAAQKPPRVRIRPPESVDSD